MMAREGVRLVIRQQPKRAQVVQESNPKNRKPIDPPPIIELQYNDREDAHHGQWLVSPRTFMMVTQIDAKDDAEPVSGKNLIGQTVSSLHKLKDINNKDGGFFVFGDISARKLGLYKLRFSLFDTSKETEEVAFLGSIDSDTFHGTTMKPSRALSGFADHLVVMVQRDFGSMSESTALTRSFSDQGVKLRVRKENRAITSVGSKRSYNSPPQSSTPSSHAGLYGGAVQSHYGASNQSPIIKRQRTSSDYGHVSMHPNMATSENTMSYYGSSVPSGARSWTGDWQNRLGSSYGHPSSSVSSRTQPIGLPSSSSWQGFPHQSTLPSPSTPASSQQEPYPSGSSHHSSLPYGDPGAVSSTPRNASYYGGSSNYTYQSQPQYPQGQQGTDSHHSYGELLPSAPIAEGTGLASPQSQGYSQSYMPSGSMYGTEQGEMPGSYAPYINEIGNKF